jgi:hypothetical protein
MRAYIVTTGAAFGLLTLAHIARMFEEGVHLITQPVFLLTTVGSASVCVWAIILLKKLGRSRLCLAKTSYICKMSDLGQN